MGPKAQAPFINRVLQDQEIVKVGTVGIQAIHTPGHTLESTCYLLADSEGK